jgi:type II secretory pathway component PulC
MVNKETTHSTDGMSANRKPRRIGTAIAALLFVGVGAWIGAQLWPHWAEYRDRQPPKPDVASSKQPVIVAPAAPDTTTSLLGTDASISDKPLQLVLVGTAPGRTLADSTATLGTDPRNPQTYAGGAILANGARIDDIQADRIVLRLDGRRETLMVDREAPARTAMSSVVNGQRAKAGYPILTPTTAEGRAGATSIGGPRAKHLDRVSSSREDLSDVVRPVPVFENDKFAGLKILPGTNSSRLAVLGLESGDIVRSVEGKLIESDAAWQSIDDALSSGGSIVVGIERNGALTSISLDGARLAEGPAAAPPAGVAQNL